MHMNTKKKEERDLKCSASAAPIDFSGISDCLILLKMRLIISQQKRILFLFLVTRTCVHIIYNVGEKKALGPKSCREFEAKKCSYQHIETEVFVEVSTYTAIWCSTAV